MGGWGVKGRRLGALFRILDQIEPRDSLMVFSGRLSGGVCHGVGVNVVDHLKRGRSAGVRLGRGIPHGSERRWPL